MPTITHTKKKKTTVELTTDETESPIEVCEEVFLRYRLSSDAYISHEAFTQMLAENAKILSYQTAMRYLQYRSRTEKEVEKHLIQKGFPQNAIEETLLKLRKYKFVNDAEYALKFAVDGSHLKNQGKKRIFLALKQKGVREDDIQYALSRISNEQESVQVQKLAEKYSIKYQGKPAKERYNKTAQALFRKGYDWDMIKRALKNDAPEEEE